MLNVIVGIISIMQEYKELFFFIFGCYSALCFIKGYYETKKGNPFGISNVSIFIGSYVWADNVVFGLFWVLATTFTLLRGDVILFGLIYSLFWAVRGLGETVYWLNEQFSSVRRNPPETLPYFKFFKNDSVWFVHQIINQCITVTALIFTIYFIKIWNP